MLTFAQFERELVSERTRDKLLERAKKGFWHGGITPYGYKRENRRLIINKKEYTGKMLRKRAKKVTKVNLLDFYTAKDLKKYGCYLIEF